MEELINFIKAFHEVKIEHIIIKHLIENGCDSSLKLREILNQDNSVYFSSVLKNHLENAMSDYEHGFIKLNKIPSVQYGKKI
jgi:hypothetical protein